MNCQVEIQSLPAGVFHNPHLPCELQGGHCWGGPLIGTDVNGNKIKLITCLNCGKVRNVV